MSVTKRYYRLIEWNGKGSGNEEISANNAKWELMQMRECTLTYNQAIKKYGKDYFLNKSDVKCSELLIYDKEPSKEDGELGLIAEHRWY